MTMTCKTCTHNSRLEIDRAIAKGGNLAEIARQYNLSYSSVWSHSRNHLSRQLAESIARREVLVSVNILEEIESLIQRSKDVLDRAESEGKLQTALKGIGECRQGYELLARIAFSLHQCRLAELELERERSGEAERERQALARDRLAILSDAELDLLEELMLKVERQDKSMEIAPDPERWVTPPDLYDDEQEVEVGSPKEVEIEAPKEIKVEVSEYKGMTRIKPIKQSDNHNS